MIQTEAGPPSVCWWHWLQNGCKWQTVFSSCRLNRVRQRRPQCVDFSGIATGHGSINIQIDIKWILAENFGAPRDWEHPKFLEGLAMAQTLDQLISAARNTQMTAEQRETQRQSFAYGNTHFENEDITRETVNRASQLLKGQANAAEYITGQSGDSCPID